VGGGQFAIELAVEFRQRFGRNFGFGHNIGLLPSLCRRLAHRASAHSPAPEQKKPRPQPVPVRGRVRAANFRIHQPVSANDPCPCSAQTPGETVAEETRQKSDRYRFEK
jgi:hypothetical protein